MAAVVGKLEKVRTTLQELHGAPEPALTDPFQLILWEQVAYLADDAKRRAAFELLEERVGLSAAAILDADLETLEEIAASGGSIAADQRAARMRDSARRVIEDWDGDLRSALELPADEAIRALTKFPMIGKPAPRRSSC